MAFKKRFRRTKLTPATQPRESDGRFSSDTRIKPSREHDEQVKFFNLISQIVHPASKLTYAVPNAAVGKTLARRLYFWKEGMRKGVLDICLDYPSGPYHGARIEMKYGDNKPSQEQWQWFHNLTNAGYKCAICYSAEEAFRFWCDYLGIKQSQ